MHISVLYSKSIRRGGKGADGESELCMALHGERRGKPEPLLDEVFQFGLGYFGLTGVCQFDLPKLQTLRWWLPQDVARSRREATI